MSQICFAFLGSIVDWQIQYVLSQLARGLMFDNVASQFMFRIWMHAWYRAKRGEKNGCPGVLGPKSSRQYKIGNSNSNSLLPDWGALGGLDAFGGLGALKFRSPAFGDAFPRVDPPWLPHGPGALCLAPPRLLEFNRAGSQVPGI